jgi:DNA processing protein
LGKLGMNNIPYLLALHSVDGLGPIRLKRIIDFFQDPKLAWQASSSDLLKLSIPRNVVESLESLRKHFDIDEFFEKLEKLGISYLTLFDSSYPKRLREIYDPPLVIYYKGEILPGDYQAIGIVGTRKVTGYGKTVTEKFSMDLAQKGLTIVSGLARGVDTVAHKAAIAGHGRTIAVLGGGLNKIFPPENKSLALEIASGNGAVLSEFPPDYPSVAGNFPARNRIISGLSMAVLVTEAAEDSGSLITARYALEQGREVFAVPGPITSSLSKGPADLIRDGARLTFSVDDILEELGITSAQSAKLKVQSLTSLSEFENKILECLSNENKHVDEVCRELKKSISEVSSALLKMEILGLIKNLGGGTYSKGL